LATAQAFPLSKLCKDILKRRGHVKFAISQKVDFITWITRIRNIVIFGQKLVLLQLQHLQSGTDLDHEVLILALREELEGLKGGVLDVHYDVVPG